MRPIQWLGATLVAFTISTTSVSAANVVETAQNAGKFNTLIAAAKAAGLVGALTGDGPITVFAPTDEAFEKLPAGTVENLLKPENKEQLVAILTYHVVGRKLSSDMLPHKKIPVRSLNGDANTLKVTKTADGVTVNEANVISADVTADNGVIHVIDKVLLPN